MRPAVPMNPDFIQFCAQFILVVYRPDQKYLKKGLAHIDKTINTIHRPDDRKNESVHRPKVLKERTCSDCGFCNTIGLGAYSVQVVKKQWDSFRNLSVTLRNNVGLENVQFQQWWGYSWHLE